MAEARRSLPVDRLVAGYLLVSSLAFAFPHRPAGWPLFVLVHLGLAGLLLSPIPGRIRAWSGDDGPTDGRRAHSLPRRFVAGLADWFPLLLMPLLYWELPFLGGALWDGHYFDGVVLGWEEALFGHQPSATLAGRWNWLLLSEILHFSYLAYYPVIYFFPAALFAAGRREEFRRTVFALMLGFTATYVVFVVFPVQGPRYLFPAPDGGLENGPLYRLAHRILESGSSRGAAFPSSHAAVAMVQTVNAYRFAPRAAPLLALITAGIAVGAVYGGFHYGVDMVAGLAVGLLLALAAPAVRKTLR